jgi:hypothetical protein
MTLHRKRPFAGALYVIQGQANLCWQVQEAIHYACFAATGEPAAIVAQALEVLRQRPEAKVRRPSVSSGTWRLILPGGVSALGQRPRGRWSRELALAASAELEPQSPLAFDNLQTAALPVHIQYAWICGLERPILDRWAEAFHKQGLTLEGIWTAAGAVVNFVGTQMPPCSGPQFWRDGRTCVQIANLGAADVPVPDIRVFASREPEGASPKLEEQGRLICPEAPLATLPLLAGLRLDEPDPSESLNLLPSHAPALTARRMAPWTYALLAWTIPLLVLATVNLWRAHQFHRQAEAARGQIAVLWHQVQGSEPLPALPLSTLEQQARSWQAAAEVLPPRHTALLSRWAALLGAVPPDLKITVTLLRGQGADIWVEGRLANAADARRLEAAWASLPGQRSDPLRLTAGAGSQVSFTARITTP